MSCMKYLYSCRLCSLFLTELNEIFTCIEPTIRHIAGFYLYLHGSVTLTGFHTNAAVREEYYSFNCYNVPWGK